jgi:hypothetical protein
MMRKPSAYFDFKIYTGQHAKIVLATRAISGDGDVVVRCETNDKDNDGYPGEITISWKRFDSLKAAIRRTGVERIGEHGQPIRVFLNGMHLTADTAKGFV